MIDLFILCHPQSPDLLDNEWFEPVHPQRIACGFTKHPEALSEANDFQPSRASWNSILFETSVLLTVAEHLDEICTTDYIGFIHTDIELHLPPVATWGSISKLLLEGNSVGISTGEGYRAAMEGIFDNPLELTANRDPLIKTPFEPGIMVWDIIKTYDPGIAEWADSNNPLMIYGHQFCCHREVFRAAASRMLQIVSQLRLCDIGIWTPHVCERLWALYLANIGSTKLVNAFWHKQASGHSGPGEYNLYGPRGFTYFKLDNQPKR